jgi:hypothetical protein
MSTATMTVIPVVLAGITPLLCGRPAEPVPGQTPRIQALARLYQDEHGHPVMPSINVFRSITSAGRFIDREPVELVHALGIRVTAIPIHSRGSWQVDTRSVRKPGSQERTVCHRPRFDDWSLVFDLLLDRDLLDPGTVASLIEVAGQRLGLGDFRAERGGPFGRFRIGHWGSP